MLTAAPAARAADPGPTPDCTGPAGNPQPGTPAWHQREQDNDYCGEQRYFDTTTNPAFARVVLKRLPQRTFVVRIVATQSTGSTLTTTRTYRGCKKRRPHGRRATTRHR